VECQWSGNAAKGRAINHHRSWDKRVKRMDVPGRKNSSTATGSERGKAPRLLGGVYEILERQKGQAVRRKRGATGRGHFGRSLRITGAMHSANNSRENTGVRREGVKRKERRSMESRRKLRTDGAIGPCRERREGQVAWTGVEHECEQLSDEGTRAGERRSDGDIDWTRSLLLQKGSHRTDWW